jgi:hypothetical protein
LTRQTQAGLRGLIAETALRLLAYCRQEGWAGYDPFDGLNSRLLKPLLLTRSRFLRLAVTQALKRAPVNLRPLLMVPKGETPKAFALFTTALLRLRRLGIVSDDHMMQETLDRLIHLRSPGQERCCWGYNFDWQSRGFFLPRFHPNIICTTFGGNALLDAFAASGNEELLDLAWSAGEFLLQGLNITRGRDEICFSYTPLDHTRIHNANLLGAAFLARLARLRPHPPFEEAARMALRFSVRRQAEDGSWPYGEEPGQEWIDNFHTGYNLVALKGIAAALDDEEARRALARGADFYRAHFFNDGCIARYYHDKMWPVDIHSVAQSIITLCELSGAGGQDVSMAVSVCEWACRNMRSPRGYFYYQKTEKYMNRIPYMRWSQAWMLEALSRLLLQIA